MKKFCVLILSILYLSTSIGATVHFHYCMDELVSWSLISTEESTCTNCGMHKKDSKGCCKDDHKQVKLDNDQKITNIVSSEFSCPIEITVPAEDHYTFANSSVAISYPVSHAPPDKSLIPVYLSNCIFRI